MRLSGQVGEIGNLGNSDLLGGSLFEDVTLCTTSGKTTEVEIGVTIGSSRKYLYSKV